MVLVARWGFRRVSLSSRSSLSPGFGWVNKFLSGIMADKVFWTELLCFLVDLARLDCRRFWARSRSRSLVSEGNFPIILLRMVGQSGKAWSCFVLFVATRVTLEFILLDAGSPAAMRLCSFCVKKCSMVG